MIFTRDFVTRENHCRIAPLVTKKSLFTVTHTLFFISCKKMHLKMSSVKWQKFCPGLNVLENGFLVTPAPGDISHH